MRDESRPLPPPSQQWQSLAQRRDQINAWLDGARPLRLVRVHELLTREEIAVSYTTLRRYVRRELAWRKKQPTVRLDDPAPGQAAQIDFGLMGTITDEEGQTRKLHALIVTLSSSRYMFVWPTLRQTTEEVCAGLDTAWRFFGGVPQYTILDSATAIAVRASATDPGLNRSFREYAESRLLPRHGAGRATRRTSRASRISAVRARALVRWRELRPLIDVNYFCRPHCRV